MRLDQPLQLGLPVKFADPEDLQALRVHPVHEPAVGIIDKSHAAGHAGAEIVTDLAKDNHTPTRHIFTSVGASSLDNRCRAGVADTQALAGLASREQLAGGCAVKDGVADDGVLMCEKGGRRRRTHDDRAARQSLADIVVGIAAHLEPQALGGECAE